MDNFRLWIPGALLLLLLSSCINSKDVEVGGIAGAFVKKPELKRKAGPVVTKFDPNHIETPKPRGQVKFAVPIDPKVEPKSDKPLRALPVKEEYVDPIPEAVRKFQESSRRR